MSRSIITVAFALVAGIVANATAIAAVTKDQTCTRKDGSTYQCSSKMLAFRNAQHACAESWKNAKADASVKDAGWPAYFSKCYSDSKHTN